MWDPPNQPGFGSGAIRALRALAILVALGAIAFFAWPFLTSRIGSSIPTVGPSANVLRIDSEPSGAAVLIDGRQIGTTPMAVDNIWEDRDIPFEVRLRGYQPWRGTFRGGTDQAVEARLVRRGAGGAR